MTLLDSKNLTQEHAVLSELHGASPRIAERREKIEGHSIVLEIPNKEELMLNCLKLKRFQ
jgi:hypothetical protein